MRAGIIGTGVIGRGWICRFLLHGWDVVAFDKDPNAAEKIQATLTNARAHVAELYDGALLREGNLSIAPNEREAVTNTDWVQESLPEDLEIKRSLYRDVTSAIPPETPLASSTSGFKPTDLGSGLDCNRQLIVCHPFNPVYLLPAVEVVASQSTRNGIRDRAVSTLNSVGMYPIEIKAEIDAHVADRLMEALWREALWLVADGVATTREIDDVMRYGFGLRWAQMGLFETYRLGGGDAGMRHFLEQFGPALAWPWSRLTDVPEMDAALIEKIALQSDAQSGDQSIAELEQRRDRNLVAILRALRDTNSAAGVHINDYLAPPDQDTH